MGLKLGVRQGWLAFRNFDQFIDLKYYVPNGEWELIGWLLAIGIPTLSHFKSVYSTATPAHKVMLPYGGANDFFVEIHFVGL